jgi:hypothetical protein
MVANAQVVIRGVLYDDASGTPLSGAVMLVDPHTDAPVVHSATDSTGSFSLQAGPGVYQIGAVRAGYVSVLSAPVTFQAGERLVIRVPIAEHGDPQHRIGVLEHIRPGQSDSKQAVADPATASGFNARRNTGMGLHFDREQLAQTGRETLGEFLQTVPGLSITNPASMTTARMSRDNGMPSLVYGSGGVATCHVGWFLDGHRMDLPGRSDPLTDGLGSLHIDMIEAVEVFRGISEMPAQFADPDLRCGAIAVWMKRS